MIQIDKGIPIPKTEKDNHLKNTYPFKTMKIGESFLLPKAVNTARSYAFKAAKLFKMKFVVKAVKEGVRIWRIA